MLSDLKIKDFAIIDEIAVEFEQGFNAITGETGAGKSILIGALGLILGGRSSEDMIRASADRAVLEARFLISDAPPAKSWLYDNGMEEGDELLIRRVISRKGKNRAFINGAMATLAQVKALGALLVDTHGQHETQTLFDTESHLPFLDSFLGLDGLCATYGKKFAEFEKARRRLKDMRDNQKEVERKLDLLKFQVQEITEANLSSGEDKKLEAEKQKLTCTDKLLQSAVTASEALEEGENSAINLAGQALAELSRMAEIDGTLKPLKESVESALIHMEEAGGELRAWASTLEQNPEKLAEVDDRLELVKALKRKYGDTIEEIIAFQEKTAKELESIEFDRDHMDKLLREVSRLGAETASLAESLDHKRVEGAMKFAKAVERQLKDLSMEKARVEPLFTYDDDPESPMEKEGRKIKLSPTGAGKIEILFSPNVGEPPKPLAKIASGGEISRVMLALKTILSGKQPRAVMVFDEIDAGIGGVTADRLGEKMRDLAKTSQVFCVTHSAQVARFSHAHYHIAKSVKGGQTSVHVKRLAREGRVMELARMAGGGSARDSALKWAEEALEGV